MYVLHHRVKWSFLVRESGRARRGAVLGLLAAVLACGAHAQHGTGESGGDDETASSVAPREELLFGDGPREPGVLSAEGTLIGAIIGTGSGVEKLESHDDEGDAVAALVASLAGGSETPAPEDGDESVEEPPAKSPGLLKRLGGLLVPGGD